jgi:TonB-linked SusC/RagA family outer membrane protein
VATTTGNAGDFSITVPGGRNTLVFTSVGYEEQQISIGSATSFAVAMKEKVSNLNEIVVTGYTAQKKKDITGSVSVINVKDLRQSPVGTGEEALQGRASGVTIISSGQPGGASDIRVRGITSFGDNSPLIVIDGVQGGSIHDINVNDIESIQVLKDASTAIYGAKGSNGVIIITTRKGKAGRAKISYDAYYGVTTRGKGYDMANTQQEANAIWQQQLNSGIAVPSDKQYGTGPAPVIPDYITPCTQCLPNPGTDPSLYDINSYQITKANKVGTNWYDVITRNSPKQSHNLSVSSGSDKSSFFFSLNYLNDQGIQRFQFLKRYSARMNTQFNIKNNIRVGENAYIYYKENPLSGNQGEGSPFSVAFREDAIIPVYDIKGNFAGTKSQGLGNARNPYADIYRTKDNKGNTWNISGNVYAEVDFLKHFTARTSFGGNINNQYGYAFSYVGYENAEGNTGANSFNESASYGSSWDWLNTLNYTNSFGNHSIVALVGTEALSNYSRYEGAGRSSYFSENPNYWTLNTGSPTGQSNSGGAYQDARFSYIGKIEYSYAGKYLVNATLRRDADSKFADSVRVGYFPGVSVAWRISQESFMKSITFLNDLKLRYSYAKLASTSNVDPKNAFNLYSSRAGKSYYAIDGSNSVPTAGFYRSNIGNGATSWEGDIISNIGLDATLFNNKLDVTLDWYKKKISGLLFTASGTRYDVLFVGDADLPKVNIGDMQNSGIDFNATYHATVAKDWKIDVTGMLTTYNNKIKSIPGLPYFNGPQIRNTIVTRNEVGHPVGAFYGYQVVGLFQSADDVAKSPTQTDASPGLFKYKDVNGDGKIDDKDRTYIGDPNPKFTYGFNLAVSYKNFDFSAFFFGSEGNDIFNQTKYFTDFPDFFKGGMRREIAVNSWTPTNTKTSIPKLRTTGGFSSDGVTSSYFISKGSYLRSKQMQIGYTLPNSILSKAGIDHLRVYVQALNLFTVTKYKGIDPELPSQPDSNGNIPATYLFGIDQASYPHTPAFLFGVNVNF